MATLTAEQAKNILENMAKEDPARFPVAVQTLIVHAFQRLDKYEQVLKMLASESKEIREVFKAMAAQAAGAPVDAEIVTPEAEAAPAVVGGEPAERVGADGEPLSAQQAEVENMMDEAIGVSPVARKNGNGKKRPAAPAAPAALRMGADGKPLDPEQAALEAQMDAAISS